MKKLIKEFPTIIAPLFIGLALTVIGAVLIIAPTKTLELVCLVLGIIAAIKSVERFIVYFKSTREGKPKIFSLISGAIIATFAIMLLAHPKPILSFFPVIVGIGLLIYAIASFSFGSKIKSIITIIIAVIIINSPMILADAATVIVGIGLLITGIIMIVTEIKALILLKKVDLSLPEDKYTEVEFTDVDE